MVLAQITTDNCELSGKKEIKDFAAVTKLT